MSMALIYTTLDWTVANYLLAAGVYFPSRTRLYCVRKDMSKMTDTNGIYTYIYIYIYIYKYVYALCISYIILYIIIMHNHLDARSRTDSVYSPETVNHPGRDGLDGTDNERCVINTQ